MLHSYATLIDLMNDIAKYGLDYRKNNDDRILIYSENSILVYARMDDNIWEKFKVGF